MNKSFEMVQKKIPSVFIVLFCATGGEFELIMHIIAQPFMSRFQI